MTLTKHDKIISIATKRGFFYPSAEIYGAKAGFWTYGHLGTLLKQKWENLWRSYFLGLDDNYFEIEGSYILPKDVFMSSGHLEHFKDPLTECKKCKFRFRADHLIEDKLDINVEGLDEKAMDKLLKDNKLTCPRCNSGLNKVKWFNMMFELRLGATGDDVGYLSPETAQNPYLSFKRQFLALREKLPLGLAMIGKAFRNEISPRQGFFRLREFTQAELQIFFNYSNIDNVEDWDNVKDYKLKIKKSKCVVEISCHELNKKFNVPKFYVYHMAKIQEFYLKLLKIPPERFRFRELSENERAFYNKIHYDIELNLDTLNGFKEVAGIHYRGDHDLGGHQKGSKEKLEVLRESNRFVPHVLELSFGVDRNVWALMDIFYKEEKERMFFNFPAITSPYETAVFPLVRNKKELVEKSREIYELIKKDFKTFYDANGSIGRRYARQDEVGTYSAITCDFQTLKDNTITLRERDTTKQVRVKINKIKDVLTKFLNGEKLSKLGKPI